MVRRFQLECVRALYAVGVVVLLCGCAHSARVLGDANDYQQYRRVRMSAGFERRLAEGWRYLRTYREGSWREQVLEWFGPAEERFRRQAWDDLGRLYGYLRVLPDGPHAESVRARVAVLEQLARAAAAEDASFMRSERDRQKRFDQATLDRLAFQRELAAWLARAGRLRAFGSAIADWDPAFKTAFFEEEPPGLCEGQRCEKVTQFVFELPTLQGLYSQAVGFSVVIELDGTALQSITVSGFQLFNRLAESASKQRVRIDDLQARAESIGTAVQMVGAAVEAEFPHERCTVEAISPTALVRRCDGQSVEMVVGESHDQPDQIQFTALAQPSAVPGTDAITPATAPSAASETATGPNAAAE